MNNKELNTLLPGIEVTVAGEKLLIQPFPFLKIPKAIALIGKLGIMIFDVIESISVKEANLDNLDIIDLTVMAAEKGLVIPEEMKEDADSIRLLIMEHLEETNGVGISMTGNKLGFEPGTFEALTSLMEKGGDQVFELLMLGTGKDRRWLESIQDPIEGIEALLAVIEVNLDFFKKRLSPLLQRVNQVLEKA